MAARKKYAEPEATEPKEPKAKATAKATKSTPSAFVPTEEYVIALRAYVERQYGTQDTQIDALREMRERRRVILLPDEFRVTTLEVRTPIVAKEIQRYTSRMTINEPTLQVTQPPSKGELGQENSTLREKVTEKILKEAGSKLPGPSTRARATDALVGDGGCWTKVLFNPMGEWDERYSLEAGDTLESLKEYDALSEEKKRDGGQPFVWMNVDPRMVYPVYAGGRLSAVLEVQKRPLYTVMERYGVVKDKDGKLTAAMGQPVSLTADIADAEVTVLEYWDKTYCLCVIEHTSTTGTSTYAIEPKKHIYERPPYFEAMGRWHGYWANRKVGKAVIEDLSGLVEYLDYLLTLHGSMAARDALPPGFLEVPDGAAPLFGEDGKPLTSFKYKSGEVRMGRPGEKLSTMQFSTNSGDLEKQIALVRQMIEEERTARVQTEGLDSSGFNTSLVLSEVKTDEDPLAQSFEQMLDRITQFIWWLIKEKLQEKVWVASGDGDWLALGPDDLASGVSTKWTVNSERANAKIVERRYHVEGISAGLESKDEAIEAEGRNPDEVREGTDMDRLRLEPEYWEVKKARLFKKVARGDIIEQTIALQRLKALQGQAGAPGQTPQPGVMGGESGVPDMGALSMAPNGAGAAPAAPQMGPGATAGQPVVQTASGAAGVQRI